MIEKLLFSSFILNGILNLGQVFFYGLKENNRPNIFLGVVFLLIAFALEGPLAWLKWAASGVPFIAFIGALTDFSDSLKPNWLNYTVMGVNLLCSFLAIYYYFIYY